MAIAVTALAVTPVKGTRIQRVERIELERSGARGNRRFFVIDRRGRMVNAKLLGDAVVRFGGHVGRCLITSRDPDTGVIDLPTLDILGRYRGELKATEPLPFGIYGRVLEPGAVRVGDVVTLGDG